MTKNEKHEMVSVILTYVAWGLVLAIVMIGLGFGFGLMVVEIAVGGSLATIAAVIVWLTVGFIGALLASNG